MLMYMSAKLRMLAVYVSQIEDASGLDKNEDLLFHKKEVKIFVNYLAEDEENEMLETSDVDQQP